MYNPGDKVFVIEGVSEFVSCPCCRHKDGSFGTSKVGYIIGLDGKEYGCPKCITRGESWGKMSMRVREAKIVERHDRTTKTRGLIDTKTTYAIQFNRRKKIEFVRDEGIFSEKFLANDKMKKLLRRPMVAFSIWGSDD